MKRIASFTLFFIYFLANCSSTNKIKKNEYSEVLDTPSDYVVADAMSASTTVRCNSKNDYIIVFKSGAVVELVDVCLNVLTSTTSVYTFYRNGKKISPIFNKNNVDAIFIKS